MDKDSNKQWFKWIIISVVTMGLALFVVKYFVTKENPLEVLFFQYVGAFSTVAVLAVFNKMSVVVEKELILKSLLIGVFVSTSLATFYLGLAQAAATLVIPTKSLLQLVFTLLVGLFIFHEKAQMTKRNWIGLLLGLVGVVFLIF